MKLSGIVGWDFYNGRSVGIFWSFLSSFLWATVYIFSRVLMRDGEGGNTDPVTLSLLRVGLGGILLFVFCAFFSPKALFCLSARDYWKIALLSQFSFVGMSVFLFWGQRYTTAVNSSMIMSASPLLTMLLAAFFFREKISFRQICGILSALCGSLLIIGVFPFRRELFLLSGVKGDLLVFCAALSWALAAILAKRLVTPENDFAVTVWSMLFASVSLIILSLLRGGMPMPSGITAWSLIVYLAVFPTALGFYAWNAALSRVELSIVNIMQYLTPVMTLLMACFFLKEAMPGLKLLGVVFVFGGVIFAAPKRNDGRTEA